MATIFRLGKGHPENLIVFTTKSSNFYAFKINLTISCSVRHFVCLNCYPWSDIPCFKIVNFEPKKIISHCWIKNIYEQNKNVEGKHTLSFNLC